MAYVNLGEFVSEFDASDSIPLTLKSYSEDFEVRELEVERLDAPVAPLECVGAVAAASFCVADEEGHISCAIDTQAVPSRTSGIVNVDPVMSKDQSSQEEAIQGILGNECLEKILKFGQETERLITEDFERAKIVLEEGVVVKVSSLLDKCSRGLLHNYVVDSKFPFLSLAIQEHKDEIMSLITINGDKKLLSFISNTGLSQSTWMMFGKMSKKTGNADSMSITESIQWTKSKRTAFYQVLSRDYPHLQARTVQDTMGQLIELRQKPSKKRKKLNNDEAAVRLYLGFTLLKQNIDHNSAMERIAHALQLPVSDVTYAGMKDTKAVTSQRVVAALSVLTQGSDSNAKRLQACKQKVQWAVRVLECVGGASAVNLHPARHCREHASVNEAPHSEISSGIAACEFKLVDKPLGLGQLGGNYFRLYLRGVPTQLRSQLKANLMKMATYGYINFFGSQRFSSSPAEKCYYDPFTGMPQSPALGEVLLSGEFYKLPGVMLASLAAKHGALYKTAADKLEEEGSDYGDVLKLMPSDSQTGRKATVEKAFLRNLVRYGARKVPLPRRGSAQSKERGVGEEIREKAEDTDTDNQKAHAMAVRLISHFHKSLWMSSYQSWIWNGAVSRRVAKHGSLPIPGDLVLEDVDSSAKEVRVLTQSEIEACSSKQIRDLAFRVVYPLVGPSVLVQPHEQSEHRDEGGVEGGALPPSIEAEVKGQNANNVTTTDDVRACKPPRGTYRPLLGKVMHVALTEDVQIEPGCLEVSFRLPPGSYATSLVAQAARNSNLF